MGQKVQETSEAVSRQTEPQAVTGTGLYADIAWHDPDRLALRYFGCALSYGQLLARIEEMARALLNYGVKAGDVVTVALPTTPESIVCVYALNRIGAVPCLIDVRFRAEKVRQIVRHTHSRLLFIMGLNLREMLSVLPELETGHIVVLSGRESLPRFVSFWASVGAFFNGRRAAMRSSERILDWNGFLARYGSGEHTPAYAWADKAPALIFQTSGTTGQAKSVLLHTENCRMAVANTLSFRHAPVAEDSVLGLIPIFSFYGFACAVHLPLSTGMSTTIVPFFRLRTLLRLLVRLRPSHVFSVPSHWAILRGRRGAVPDLSFLKSMTVAGEAMMPALEREVNDFLRGCGAECALAKAYGMTETAGVVAVAGGGHPAQYTQGFSGRVLSPNRIAVQDGELCVLAEGLYLGYYGNPEANARLMRRHEDGLLWIHTGDMGYLDDDGCLYVTGRKKRMLVRPDGSKLFPAEIEGILSQSPLVALCAVTASGTAEPAAASLPLTAFILPSREGRLLSEKKLKNRIRQFCLAQLPANMRPGDIRICDSLPLTASGKIAYERL